jgi:hypothetical protein
MPTVTARGGLTSRTFVARSALAEWLVRKRQGGWTWRCLSRLIEGVGDGTVGDLD